MESRAVCFTLFCCLHPLAAALKESDFVHSYIEVNIQMTPEVTVTLRKKIACNWSES